MSTSQVEGVRSLAAKAVAPAGLVVEDVTISSAGRRRVVRVVVDLPPDKMGGVPMDAVSDASRELSAALDASDVLGQMPYVLEVSSPGVSRPLTQRHHWMRARTRLVKVRMVDGDSAGSEVLGRLTDVDDAGVHLSLASGENLVLAWDRVVRGEVQIEFGAISSADDDVADDDEIADDELDDEEEQD